MEIDLTYSDLKRLIESIKGHYQSAQLPDYDVIDLLELEFKLSNYLTEALREDGYEIKKGKALIPPKKGK